MVSSSSDVKQLTTKAVNGTVTKGVKGVSESGNKAKKQEEQESGSDDDFQTAVMPLTH